MKLLRLLRHLTAPGWSVRRALGSADLDAIGAAVAASEARHRGEVCIVIEGPLPWVSLWRDQSARTRAAALFTEFSVDATREASGLLLYVQLLDRQVELLADRGIAAVVAQEEWDALCRTLEQAFARGEFENGLLAAVDRMTALLVEHFPADGDNPNELPNRPRVL